VHLPCRSRNERRSRSDTELETRNDSGTNISGVDAFAVQQLLIHEEPIEKDV